MALPALTRDQIDARTSGGSFERGEQYLADGAIRALKRTDARTIKAQVQGSDVHPYVVKIKFNDEDVTQATCSCPYVEGSWCKHIVAVLLKLREDDEIPAEESAKVAPLLQDLDRPALVSLIERLVEHAPELIEEIKRERARLEESE